MFSRRPNKSEAMLFDHFGEGGIFGHEADAGMNGVHACDGRRCQDRRNVQITVPRRRRPNTNAFIGQAHMHGIGIRRRMDGHRMDAHLAAGTMDTKCDFTAIGYEYFFKQDENPFLASGAL